MASEPRDPAGIVLLAAAVVGAVGLAAGFLGPLVLAPSNNLGPLLGLFVTGPVGALAGALWGITRAARAASAAEMRALLRWLAGVWVLILLYTLFVAKFGPHALLPAAGLQLLVVVASTALLLGRRDARQRLPAPVRRSAPVAVMALALVALSTIFPPVTAPWWGPATAQSTARLPAVAFLLDARFDASSHVPVFAVDRRTLVLEWLVATGVAVGVSFVLTRGRRGSV